MNTLLQKYFLSIFIVFFTLFLIIVLTKIFLSKREILNTESYCNPLLSDDLNSNQCPPNSSFRKKQEEIQSDINRLKTQMTNLTLTQNNISSDLIKTKSDFESTKSDLILTKKKIHNFSQLVGCSQTYCNGDTWESCVRANGSEWCQKTCRNVGPNDYCNGDTWAGCVRANGQGWCQDNCKNRSNQLYNVGCFENNPLYVNVSLFNQYKKDTDDKLQDLRKDINNPFRALIMSKPPWGIYAAESFSNNTLYELRNNGRNAICTKVSLTNGSGYGASVSIPYIYGSTTSIVNWPDGSIPINFTVCSITRYTGSSKARILTSRNGNWLHGHWYNHRGVTYYENWIQQVNFNHNHNRDEIVNNWVVTCGKNNGTAPDNILIDGVARGQRNGGIGGQTGMTINGNPFGELSDWAFSHVFIWDQNLSNAEMVMVSNALMQYLVDGLSFKRLFI